MMLHIFKDTVPETTHFIKMAKMYQIPQLSS